MKRLLALILLLTPALCAAKPVEPSLRMLPLSMRLKLPLFQVVGSGAIGSGAGSGGGGGGGGGFPDPGSNGILARTSLGIATPRTIIGGVGVLSTNGDGVSGNPTLDYDSAIIPNYSSGTATPSASCSAGTLYFESDRDALWSCSHTDTWTDLSVPLASRVSGVIPIANLATGTPDGTKFIKDDGTLAVPAGGSTFDPTVLDIFEEFATGTAVAGQAGTNGFYGVAINTGTLGANEAAADTATWPGTYQLLAHATNDDSGYFLGMSSGVAGMLQRSYMTHDFDFDAVVVMPASMTSRVIWVGLMSSTGAPTWTSGVYVRYDTDLSDATFIFAICDSSTTGCQSAGDDTNQKVVASTVTPVAATGYRFRISRCATCGPAGVQMVSFRVNDETAKTFCSSGCDDDLTQLPGTTIALTAGVAAMTRAASAGAIAMAQPDYYRLHMTGITRY